MNASGPFSSNATDIFLRIRLDAVVKRRAKPFADPSATNPDPPRCWSFPVSHRSSRRGVDAIDADAHGAPARFFLALAHTSAHFIAGRAWLLAARAGSREAWRKGSQERSGAAQAGEFFAARGMEMKRVVISSIIGTAVEWYDFLMYATASALVFPKLFFPPPSRP